MMQIQMCKRIKRYSAIFKAAVCLVFVFQVVFLSHTSIAFADDSDVWDALKSGGHVALLRHATAPGTGDPENFELGNCMTQRNLSAAGRRQAVRIGEKFRANGIDEVKVYTSQWCRCVETATLTELGTVQELPLLNSFFRQFEREVPQTQKLKKWLSQQDLKKPILLVTHQVNITALTGVFPASGELVLVKRSKNSELVFAGRLKMD